jgi:hypothetical protein
MDKYKIVETDNFDGDYPNEKFVEPLPYFFDSKAAQKVADVINSTVPENHNRFWKVVKMPYTLQPGFEP